MWQTPRDYRVNDFPAKWGAVGSPAPGDASEAQTAFSASFRGKRSKPSIIPLIENTTV